MTQGASRTGKGEEGHLNQQPFLIHSGQKLFAYSHITSMILLRVHYLTYLIMDVKGNDQPILSRKTFYETSRIKIVCMHNKLMLDVKLNEL